MSSDSPRKDGPPQKKRARQLDDYARHAGLGVQFAATIGLLGALGYWADRSFGTSPWLLITGILLGSVLGFVSLVRRFPSDTSRGSGSGGRRPQ